MFTVGLIQKQCQLCVWCVLWVRREKSCLGDVYSWSDTEAVSALCLVCLVSQGRDVVSRWCLQLIQKPCQLCVWCVLWVRRETSCLGDVYSWSDTEAVSALCLVCLVSQERDVVSRWCLQLVWYRSRVSSVFGVSCESGERRRV